MGAMTTLGGPIGRALEALHDGGVVGFRLDVELSGLHRSVLPSDFGGGWVEDVGMVHPQIAWAPTPPDEVPR